MNHVSGWGKDFGSGNGQIERKTAMILLTCTKEELTSSFAEMERRGFRLRKSEKLLEENVMRYDVVSGRLNCTMNCGWKADSERFDIVIRPSGWFAFVGGAVFRVADVIKGCGGSRFEIEDRFPEDARRFSRPGFLILSISTILLGVLSLISRFVYGDKEQIFQTPIGEPVGLVLGLAWVIGFVMSAIGVSRIDRKARAGRKDSDE